MKAISLNIVFGVLCLQGDGLDFLWIKVCNLWGYPFIYATV